MASVSKRTVIVRLEVINEEEAGESNAYRYLTLDAPSYSVRIGRGSRSGSRDLYPAENNAWFDSRVMSREHAILRANLGTKTLTIEDVGSMHGTYLPADDLKLSMYQPQVVRDGDAIVFGAEVSRGPDTFPALEIDVFYNFDYDEDEEEDTTHIVRARPDGFDKGYTDKPPLITNNSFSVPDYDDYDSEENDESEIEGKAIPPPPRDAAIPESIISISGSFGSDEEEAPYEPWNRSYCNTFESKGITGELKSAHNAMQEAIGSSSKGKTAPADLIMWVHGSGNQPDTSSASNEAPASQTPAENGLPSTSQQADVQAMIKVQSKILPTPSMIETCANLTDEQSESDYGDDISADLFDEEFEMNDYQRVKPQLDTSSFSSQSPILTSLPSKIELAARQPTVKVATKSTLPRSPFLGSAPVEQRAPSPSDAAMPKAKSAYASFEYKSPAEATTTPQPSQNAFSSTVAYPTTSRDTSFMRSYGYTSSQDVNNVQDTYPQPCYPVELYSQYYDPTATDWTWGASRTVNKPAAAAPKTLVPEPWGVPHPAPASPFVTIKTTPRVAIKDLVDEPETVEGVNQKHRGKTFTKFVPIPQSPDGSAFLGLKRKADQISEAEELPSISVSLAAVEDFMEPFTSQGQEDAQVIKTLAFTTDSTSQTDLWGSVSMIDTTISAPLEADHHDQTTEERPKKKARSDLYKYAAGAVGGIAIGAVGVVAALVTLPPDFFV